MTDIEKVIDIKTERLVALCDQLDNNFLKTFMGVEISVDNDLKGNDWHVVVSQELFDRLSINANKKV